MTSRLLEWTIVGCFPAAIFVLMGVLELPSFVDPCHGWSTGPDGTGAATAVTCTSHTSTTESRAQAATRLLLFQGTTLLALVMGLVGARRGLGLVVAAAAGLLALVALLAWGRLELLYPLVSAVLFGVGLILFPPPARPPLAGPRQGPRQQ